MDLLLNFAGLILFFNLVHADACNESMNIANPDVVSSSDLYPSTNESARDYVRLRYDRSLFCMNAPSAFYYYRVDLKEPYNLTGLILRTDTFRGPLGVKFKIFYSLTEDIWTNMNKYAIDNSWLRGPQNKDPKVYTFDPILEARHFLLLFDSRNRVTYTELVCFQFELLGCNPPRTTTTTTLSTEESTVTIPTTVIPCNEPLTWVEGSGISNEDCDLEYKKWIVFEPPGLYTATRIVAYFNPDFIDYFAYICRKDCAVGEMIKNGRRTITINFTRTKCFTNVDKILYNTDMNIDDIQVINVFGCKNGTISTPSSPSSSASPISSTASSE